MFSSENMSERSRKVFWTAFQSWLSEATLEELAELEWALAQSKTAPGMKLASHVSIAFNREVQARLAERSAQPSLVVNLPVAQVS